MIAEIMPATEKSNEIKRQFAYFYELVDLLSQLNNIDEFQFDQLATKNKKYRIWDIDFEVLLLLFDFVSSFSNIFNTQKRQRVILDQV